MPVEAFLFFFLFELLDTASPRLTHGRELDFSGVYFQKDLRGVQRRIQIAISHVGREKQRAARTFAIFLFLTQNDVSMEQLKEEAILSS